MKDNDVKQMLGLEQKALPITNMKTKKKTLEELSKH